MPHFSDDPGADEDPDLLGALRRMLRAGERAPHRLPTCAERFGVPAPRDRARDAQDAVLAGPDPRPPRSRHR
ncbi:hypothetical protein [Methylobacterium sp. 275MFSha3.1]|uniref:hypothetical protein n=1 Tax=Methylobacterium sp. 275MFSha3.1 TaxID=1502746 RepID=UPI000A81043C|nr:hypothetical protein [Methylobacterium sp. 275MFSha3.1]